MRITQEKRLVCAPAELTAKVLHGFIENVDEDAVVDVRTDHPDRPGETSTVTVTVTEAREVRP